MPKAKLSREEIIGRNRAIDRALDVLENHSDDPARDHVGPALVKIIRDFAYTCAPDDRMQATKAAVKAIRAAMAEFSEELKAIDS